MNTESEWARKYIFLEDILIILTVYWYSKLYMWAMANQCGYYGFRALCNWEYLWFFEFYL